MNIYLPGGCFDCARTYRETYVMKANLVSWFLCNHDTTYMRKVVEGYVRDWNKFSV